MGELYKSTSIISKSSYSAFQESSILDILMYFDLSKFNKPKANSKPYKLKEILTDLRKKIDLYVIDQKDKALPNYLSAIEAYSKEHPEILDYEVTNVSTRDPRYSGIRGLNAAVFSKPDENSNRSITIAFRGTASGEWYDNGQGLGGIDVGADKESLQQKEAVRYFEDTYKELNINKNDYLTLTGHSKGGNKIQYIMMMSQYADNIKDGYSFDGQGFSPEAITHFKEKLGDKFIERTNKLYTIAADNDYVNVLGNSIIPNENRYYFEANCKHLFENHYPHAIFKKDGTLKELKERPHEPGFWGQVMKNASDKIMSLPTNERNKITTGMMTIAQRVLGKDTPINKEKMSNWLMIISAVKAAGFLTAATLKTLAQRIFKQPQNTELPEPQLDPDSKNTLNKLVSKNEHDLPGKDNPLQEQSALSMKEWKQQIQMNRNSIGKDISAVKVNQSIKHER